MTRFLLLFCFVLLCLHRSNATSYYFSSVTGNDARSAAEASNPSTPWKTLTKFNAIAASLQPGDSVFFKRGEAFAGSMTPTVSGTAGSVVYYGAYGTGTNPLITGFTTISGWVAHSAGIFYAPLTATNLQMVTINGAAKGRGRWPNTGYLKVNSHYGNQSITSTGLSGAPTTNFAGGEIVIRKYRFILDRHTITSQSGNTLNYNTVTTNGWNAGYVPVDGNGFFVQGHLSTLDQPGEWHYDATAKRLYVHFGADVPPNYIIKAALQDFNVSLTSLKFLTFENLDFEGGNTKGLNMTNCTNINITNCNFNNEGGFAISGKGLNFITVKGGTVNQSLSNGINFDESISNCTVDGVTVTNTNMIAGTGRSGSGVGNGITVNGNGVNILNNRVINCGYSGIQFFGDNVLVEKNYVDGFCYLKDDGGGIYTFNGPEDKTEYNRIIRNNIVLNAVGNFESAQTYWWEAYGKAAGIYLDEHVNNVIVTGNTIANGDWAGMFIHNTHDCQITNNIVYNHRYQMHLSQYSLKSRNMLETGNQYVAPKAFQMTWFYRTYIADSPTNMGTSNNNYFARPLDDNKTIRVGFLMNSGGDTTDISLAQWQSQYGLDLNSKKSPVTFTANGNDSIRFEYNASNGNRSIALDAEYIDVTGAPFTGTLTLAPWTSVVLLKSKTPSGPVVKKDQTVTFPPIADRNFGDGPFTVSPTASSGLPVGLQVISGPASLSGNTVSINGGGTVVIEATQSGNAGFNPAPPVQRSFTVNRISQTISFGPLPNRTVGEAPFAVSAVSSSGLLVSFRIVSGPASISGNTVTVNGAGEVIIEATQEGNGNYTPALPVMQSFIVQSVSTVKQSQTITFSSLPYRNFGTPPFDLTATSSSGLPVSYRVVSGPATVAGATVTLTGAGSVMVEAMQPGDGIYNAAAPVQRGFTVGKGNQSISFPAIGSRSLDQSPVTLNATATSGLAISYRVISGPATVSGNQLTLTATGSVSIEATQPGNTNWNAAWAVSQTFSVTAAAGKQNQTITFPPIANRTVGDAPFVLNATASSGLTVSYRVVSGPASVSGNTVTINGAGEVVIEASQAGNGSFNPALVVNRSFMVTNGTKQDQEINFAALPGRTFGAAPFTLSATASSGLPVSFTIISGPATISGTTLTITGAGTVTVQATQSGDAVFNAAPPLQQSFAVAKASQTITFGPLPNRTVGDAPFNLTATASSGLPVSYRVVSGPATVSGATVTLAGAGEVTIESSQAGNANYLPAPVVNQIFTIQSAPGVKQSQTLTFPSLSYRTYGNPPFNLTATASSGLPVSYRVVSGPVTISGSTVTIIGTGSVMIEATQPGDATFNAAAPVQRGFTVGKAGQTITFPTPPNRTLGDGPFQLSATASSGLAVVYRVVSGPATVSGNTVSLTGTGTVTIEASQPGNEFYNAASFKPQRSFTVTATTSTLLTSREPMLEQTTTNQGVERMELSVFPNPVRRQGIIRLMAQQNTAGYLAVYDGAGNLVKQLGFTRLESSRRVSIDLVLPELAKGTYFLRFNNKKTVVSRAFGVM
jgi:parallel beta-helix repeat protein